MLSEITIQFTDKCNINCPYCFAKTKNNNMLSSTDFDIFINFCYRESLDVIHITGGEPSLNFNFSDYVTRLAKIADLVIYTNFTTANLLNGIKIDEPKRIVFLVNMNSKNFCSLKETMNFQKNFENAIAKNFRVALSYTFYRGARFINQEFDELITIMRAYHLKNLRVSQALTFSKNKVFMSREDVRILYHYVAEKILNWTQEGFSVYFDCPVPPCYIDLEDFQLLRKCGAISIKCIPKAFIMWNLNATHCYSTMNNSNQVSLMCFDDLAEIKQYSKILLQNIQNQNNRNGCLNCVYGEDGFSCGCPLYST